MFWIFAEILFPLMFLIKKVMAIISMMEKGGLAKDHWCLLEGKFVVHFTRHK